MKNFVFGILTYNQEEYVLQTLESIKFQKINYGSEKNVSLIITDDASKDRTVELIEQWCQKNKEYFDQIHLIANKENKGTVENYKTILHMVKDEDMKLFAGDDLIGHGNIFAEYETLTDKKLKTYVRIELCNGNIRYREKYLIDFYYHKHHANTQKYHLKNFRRGKYLHSPSTNYTKKLFVNAACEENLEGYRLFEDDPMWYSMIKNEKELQIEFIEHGIILYRVHDQSVSNGPNPIFAKDMEKLRKQYLNDTKGLEKLYLLIRMKTNGWPLYVNPGLYLDKFMNMKRERICKKDPGYYAFKEKIEQQIKEEQKFYDAIMGKIPK